MNVHRFAMTLLIQYLNTFLINILLYSSDILPVGDARKFKEGSCSNCLRNSSVEGKLRYERCRAGLRVSVLCMLCDR